MAFSSLDDFTRFTEDNQAIIDFEGVTRDQMAGLTEIVSEELRSRDGSVAGVRTKIKLADKQNALMNLAKLINMLQPDKVEHTGRVARHAHAHAHVVLNPRDMSPRSAPSSSACCCRSRAARTTTTRTRAPLRHRRGSTIAPS